MKKFASFSLLLVLFLSGCTSAELPEPTPNTLGNASAPILVQEFADLQCPACGVVSPQLKQLIQENPDLARLEYYHFPLAMHQYAFIASEAAECADDQGKFWEFIDIIYKNQDSLNEDYIKSTADSLGLNRTDFDACLDSGKYKTLVQSHMKKGNEMGVGGTPTIYVDGQMVRWSNPETFKAYLESLKK